MPGVDFQALRTEITMEHVLNQLGFVPTSRHGDQLHGPCPIHGSTSPDSRLLSINLETIDTTAKNATATATNWSSGHPFINGQCTRPRSISVTLSAETFLGSHVGDRPTSSGTEEKRHQYLNHK